MTRLLGYVTIEDFENHLNVVLKDRDRAAALRFLRTAEDAVSKHVGGRSFLPLEVTLTEDLTDSATTATVDFRIDRFNGSGLLLVGSEVMRYNVVSADDAEVTIRVARGVMGTTAAAHLKDDVAHEVRSFRARNHPILITPDYLELHHVWYTEIQSSGTVAEEIDITEFGIDSTQVPPYTEIQRPSGWSLCRNTQEWLVAATWGYGWLAPPDIQVAVLRVAEDLWARRGTGLNQIASQYIDGIGMKYRPVALIPGDVAEILGKYRVWRC